MRLTLLSVGLLSFSFAQGAAAQQPAIGTLSCTVSGSMGVFVAAQKSLKCRFTASTGAVQSYTGLVSKFEPNMKFTAAPLEWTVSAPSAAAGALAGQYQRDGSALTSASVTLQPLSPPDGNTLNIATGVVELHLWFER